MPGRRPERSGRPSGHAARPRAALDGLRAHLARHVLPEPVTVEVTTWRDPVAVHLQEPSLSAFASALLAWAQTLDGVTVTAQRMKPGDSVHLVVVGRIALGVPVHVWGAVRFDRAVFPDLPVSVKQNVELSALHVWARREEAA